LWNDEKRIFAAGDLGFPVYETPLGRIGLHICYDGWFPESCRSAALAGADVVCVPANWVPVPTQPAGFPAFATMLALTAAHTNQLYIVAASRIGTERGQSFLGRSIIADHHGTPLAGPAGDDEPAILTALIDPIGTRGDRQHNPFNRPLHDRRPDAYRVTGAVDKRLSKAPAARRERAIKEKLQWHSPSARSSSTWSSRNARWVASYLSRTAWRSWQR
jgi:predicted amidohydrolase